MKDPENSPPFFLLKSRHELKGAQTYVLLSSLLWQKEPEQRRVCIYNRTSSIILAQGDGKVPSTLRHSQVFEVGAGMPPHGAVKLPDLGCLPKPADIQAEMVAEDVLSKLRSLLASGSEDVCRASIALLWILSQHPHNQVGEVISQDQRGKRSSGHHLVSCSIVAKLHTKGILRMTSRLCETSQPFCHLPKVTRFCLVHLRCR